MERRRVYDNVENPISRIDEMSIEIFVTNINGKGNEKIRESHHEGEDTTRWRNVCRL